MEKPKIAATKPAAVELVNGTNYYWCQCGESKDQPFCDGSHKKTSFKPVSFIAERSETAYLCQCKQTKTAPFCDGSHKLVKVD